jgi:GDP-mannose 6-dehydrogenase
MNIAVFGLGYVGSVTAASLAAAGHQVTGVDVSAQKVALIRQGKGPVQEPGLDELIYQEVKRGSLKATDSAEDAVVGADLVLICVGTPSRPDGSIDTSHVTAVGNRIGEALREHDGFPTIVLRSTVLPGTTRDLLIPTIEQASGKSHSVDFEVCFNPEFLREGSSLADFSHPPKIVIGTDTGKPNSMVSDLYGATSAPVIETAFEVAELAKYVDNTWHALKVTFANEIGRLAKDQGIDSREVMRIMVQDTLLNISAKYLKPGFAYGGSCLPKDIAALTWRARQNGVDIPVIDAIAKSNRRQIEEVAELIWNARGQRVGILGLSFKPDTDDVRNSPTIDLIELLSERGIAVQVFDPIIETRQMLGANLEYLLDRLPNIDGMLITSARQLVETSDIVVLTKHGPGFLNALGYIHEHGVLLDLVGLPERPARGEYVGISW